MRKRGGQRSSHVRGKVHWWEERGRSKFDLNAVEPAHRPPRRAPGNRMPWPAQTGPGLAQAHRVSQRSQPRHSRSGTRSLALARVPHLCCHSGDGAPTFMPSALFTSTLQRLLRASLAVSTKCETQWTTSCVLLSTMGNCVGRADDYVLPPDRHKWIAKYGQQVVRGLLDCENSNLLAFNRKCAATNTALYCHKNLYSSCFDPCFPLPSELKMIDPKIVEKLAAERKSSKAAAVVPEVPESPLEVGKEGRREANQTQVRSVSSVKEKSAAWKRETVRSSAADLNVYAVTWNMNGKVPTSSNFADLLDVSGEGFDFFVVGLQEAPYFDAKTSISEVLGDKYCMIEASVLMSLQLFIFAKRSLKPFISGVKVDKVWEKRLSGVVGKQKGAAAVRLHFEDKSLLFITSHLAPHESNVKARNAQCAHICHSVFARSTSALSCFQPATISDDVNSKVPGALSNVVEESDVVIWLGDLNYRVELPRSTVQTSIKNKKLQELWVKDQLSIALRKGQAFKGFQEGPLLFLPTFKYDIGTDNYDSSSKERVPSWTDRILYKASTVKAELRSYGAIDSLKTSDHRPVKAHLTLKSVL